MRGLFSLPIFLFLLIALMGGGCGYRFAGGGTLPGGVKSICISVLENRSGEMDAEMLFTNDLIYEFSKNGVEIRSRDSADVLLEGAIDGIRVDTVSRKGQISSLERRVRAVVSLKLSDPKGGVKWQGKKISENETYSVLSDKSDTEANKQAALEALSKRLAEKIYARMTEDF